MSKRLSASVKRLKDCGNRLLTRAALTAWAPAILAAAVALTFSCGGGSIAVAPMERQTYRPELPTTPLTLPDGSVFEVELAITPEEQGRGLMFREYLPPDKGMLFVGERSEARGFWMFQCLIALDMLWLDGNHVVVEIEPDVPPCREADARKCPTYGGRVNSIYVLELAAGQVEAHGLKLGDRLEF